LLNLVKFALTLALGAAIGLGVTYAALRRGHGFGLIHAGPWTGAPRAGAIDADPYARAVTAQTGEVPLGAAEGLMFVARTDDAGAPLDGRCSYRVAGPIPTSRYWTLTTDTPAGFLIDNPAHRYGFTSQEIVRDSNGGFAIIVSPSASPGNWLPIGAAGRFVLVLRLYDTPLGTASTLDAKAMPSIAREACS
jgi:hypothetical protein